MTQISTDKNKKTYVEIDKIHRMFRGALEDLFSAKGFIRDRLSIADRNFYNLYWDRDFEINIPDEVKKDFLIVKKYMHDSPCELWEEIMKPYHKNAEKLGISFDEYMVSNFPTFNKSMMISRLDGKIAKKTAIAIMKVYFSLEDKMLELQKEKNLS